MAVGLLPQCCRLLLSSKWPRRGSLSQNQNVFTFRVTPTSQPFFGLKRRHHGLSSAKTQITRQSFLARVSIFWRFHSLD
jgi:hypothetical protein